MPLYDLRCTDCELEEERLLPIADKDSAVCDSCGAPMRTLIRGAAVIGITHSRPLDYSRQLGRVFESNAELRKYQADNPSDMFTSKSSPEFKAMKEKVQEHRHTTATSAGYKSTDHMMSELKKAKNRP